MNLNLYIIATPTLSYGSGTWTIRTNKKGQASAEIHFMRWTEGYGLLHYIRNY
jgi:hypothetical protein